ncbi:hypothetical protein Aglo01_26950 [Actinokineospora globicatena]|uniref:Uncharacterized protein n=1 Tax=Actinokineospora globicatena TaxID=103729 RepID=A0A9W6QLQ7_9PSEU|nr:hypothetical protein Aglo01_26950 [Actinokineospora globicatena]GLW85121.1 hypothetical protein Aglo02_27610 [Actinokineospora globicatena]GLW90819.1 hypothetical protein Aglo03_16350 [Actinokineospora globicatena]
MIGQPFPADALKRTAESADDSLVRPTPPDGFGFPVRRVRFACVRAFMVRMHCGSDILQVAPHDRVTIGDSAARSHLV